jgi:hypothetical protein
MPTIKGNHGFEPSRSRTRATRKTTKSRSIQGSSWGKVTSQRGTRSSYVKNLLVKSSTSVLWLKWVTQWFSGEPLQTPLTRCSLRQSPLMSQLPRSPGSTLVLRLNQETVHDFVPLFLPPCGPHLTPLATGSLEPSLLVFSTLGGLTGDDLSRLFFTCTNTSQTVTCTCNT